MEYMFVKLSHISFATISISLFIIRCYWSYTESTSLQQQWVKIVPHVNDTLLLSCAIFMMVQSGQYPFEQHWLTTKVIALLFYIGFGTIAIKRGKTPTIRATSALLAALTFCYLVLVAIRRNPWPF